MRTRSWSDLAGARVGVWGLGVEGRATLARLRALGAESVQVVDVPTEPGVLATGAGGLEALAACVAVVKSPGISRHRPEVAELESRGVPVLGGLGLWLQDTDPRRVVGVTGTKGKSTTTAILGHLLRGLGVDVTIGGNLGTPPWAPDAPATADLWVVEISSYQATDLVTSPAIMAVTSLHPDHLTWHGDVATYYADKLSACTRPGADLTIANGADARLREHRALLGPRVRWVDPAPAPWADSLGLPGAHNTVNAMIAAACIDALGLPAGDSELRAAAEGFAGLPSRLHRIATIAGVDFIDDSLATNVLPTIAAIDAFPGRPLALLAGGFDRGIDYTPLADHLADRQAPTLVVPMPTTGHAIAEALDGRVEVATTQDLAAAVHTAFTWAQPQAGVVLLSPAAASFDRYADYRARAAAFAAAVEQLPSRPR